MATLYFNGAVDSDWDEIGNWWTSGAFTTQASALPTSSDSVVLSATCDTNSGSTPTVVNLTMNGSSILNILIGVTSLATFNDGSQCNLPSYDPSYSIGNAVFNDTSSQVGEPVITATFNDNSSNYTYVDAGIFNDSSTNSAQVSSGGIFNDNASNGSGGNSYGATFNGSSSSSGTVTGDATFNGSSSNNTGTVTNNATFNGSSSNAGTVTGNGTFNDTSSNLAGASVGGDAAFNDSSYNNGGLVSGNSTITGKPIRIDSPVPNIGFSFSRAQLGVNGSSILGVI